MIHATIHELFFSSFRKKVAISPEEQAQIQQYLIPKKLRRRQYFLQEGAVCEAFAFVGKGTLRTYLLDEVGAEHIIQFGIEGWIVGDTYSFLTGESSTYNIDAIEDSELMLVSREAHEEMLRTIPKYETFTRLNITGAYIAMQRRLMAALSTTNEERYEAFVQLYPQIVARVPQHMIASYLGMNPETLSRIRKRLLIIK